MTSYLGVESAHAEPGGGNRSSGAPHCTPQEQVQQPISKRATGGDAAARPDLVADSPSPPDDALGFVLRNRYRNQARDAMLQAFPNQAVKADIVVALFAVHEQAVRSVTSGGTSRPKASARSWRGAPWTRAMARDAPCSQKYDPLFATRGAVRFCTSDDRNGGRL